jgi:hypothetical protein
VCAGNLDSSILGDVASATTHGTGRERGASLSTTSLFVQLDKPLTIDQIERLPDVIDYGKGAALTNFNGTPDAKSLGHSLERGLSAAIKTSRASNRSAPRWRATSWATGAERAVRVFLERDHAFGPEDTASLSAASRRAEQARAGRSHRSGNNGGRQVDHRVCERGRARPRAALRPRIEAVINVGPDHLTQSRPAADRAAYRRFCFSSCWTSAARREGTDAARVSYWALRHCPIAESNRCLSRPGFSL